MTTQPPPSAAPPPRPQTISQVSTTFLALNFVVLVVLCGVMIVWLRPLLVSQGVEATASTLYALSAGLLLFTILSRGTKTGLLKDHREGVAHTHAGRYEDAITSFQKSYDFLAQSRWVDDLRWLVCLDSSAIGYREMALYNIGYCRLRMGDAAGAQATWGKLLAEFPQTRLKDEITKDIAQLEGRKPAA
jgi:tetratricopeptide (TPR) repeat protein